MSMAGSYLLLCLLFYFILQRRLRHRRRDAAVKRCPTRESYASMTLDEAFHIQSKLAEVEFPTVFPCSIFSALFKTYGIPSISELLVATGQLARDDTASKRAADTGVILTEVVLHHPSNPRAIDGIARMNYLHKRYRKAGKISDHGMLYTLSLLVLEPIRWTTHYEWREVSEVERCAMGVYWQWMGEAMEISFKALPSFEDDWRDGLHFSDEFEAWSRGYESAHMVPAESNETVANGTIKIALTNLPRSLYSLAHAFVAALLEPRLQEAMRIAEPTSLTVFMLNLVVQGRKMIIRHLFLPRPQILRKRRFTDEPDAAGRIHSVQFVAHPWYVKPSFSWRYGIKALLLRLAGGKLPGDDGDNYRPEGYKIPEIGPETLKGKGSVEMEGERARLSANPRLGCPFSRW
ncbi:hypothetical protein B9Z65_3239 [Elsinoe australis]|uniref:Uncharacterized protein n=1 Tax=Elsinoe australis TaxID=40998 RepID=A0A2P7ZUT2_9PEZI|nr:hypothetical protein B9Z65_3239 [Elsinoe australis]